MERKLYLLYETHYDYSDGISHKEVMYVSNDYCFLMDKKDEYESHIDHSVSHPFYEIKEMSEFYIHIVK